MDAAAAGEVHVAAGAVPPPPHLPSKGRRQCPICKANPLTSQHKQDCGRTETTHGENVFVSYFDRKKLGRAFTKIGLEAREAMSDQPNQPTMKSVHYGWNTDLKSLNPGTADIGEAAYDLMRKMIMSSSLLWTMTLHGGGVAHCVYDDLRDVKDNLRKDCTVQVIMSRDREDEVFPAHSPPKQVAALVGKDGCDKTCEICKNDGCPNCPHCCLTFLSSAKGLSIVAGSQGAHCPRKDVCYAIIGDVVVPMKVGFIASFDHSKVPFGVWKPAGGWPMFDLLEVVLSSKSLDYQVPRPPAQKMSRVILDGDSEEGAASDGESSFYEDTSE
ncbi:unnamed protein product [Prorocentrum cordatum]|uniref:RING-type E3 ubiquitin transferase n=1 Tax=Prorocentrum cordatum TaxID=2364126 RepID=A0ABN9T7W0_9DINO|nr:unnamed protein product [Polarella glacialis]